METLRHRRRRRLLLLDDDAQLSIGGAARACGSIFGSSAGQAHGISFLAHTGRPAPDYIVGPVTATAKTVVITLSNGTTLQTKAIAPPKEMTTKIAFYVTQLPRPAEVMHLQALDSQRRPVAHLSIRRRT